MKKATDKVLPKKKHIISWKNSNHHETINTHIILLQGNITLSFLSLKQLHNKNNNPCI